MRLKIRLQPAEEICFAQPKSVPVLQKRFTARDHALIGIVSWTARADGEPACGFVSGVIPLARYRYWILETAARLGSPLEP